MKLWQPFSPVRSRILPILLGGQILLFFILWIASSGGIVPSPLEVAHAWGGMVQGQGLLVELITSIKVSLLSLALAGLLSTIIVFLATAPLFWPMAKFISALRFLGFVGLTFIFTLAFNDGFWLKIALLTFGITVFMTTNLLAEAKALPQSAIDHCRTMNMQGWRISWELLIRGKLDVILDLIRQNAAIAWTLLTMVEGLVRSGGGIGALLLNQNRHLHLSGILAIQLTILFYGLLQDGFLAYLRQVACPHLSSNR